MILPPAYDPLRVHKALAPGFGRFGLQCLYFWLAEHPVQQPQTIKGTSEATAIVAVTAQPQVVERRELIDTGAAAPCQHAIDIDLHQTIGTVACPNDKVPLVVVNAIRADQILRCVDEEGRATGIHREGPAVGDIGPLVDENG